MYHDCNADFKKRKRIEKENKKCRKCYIQGPTGPQGSVGTAILDSYASLYEDNGNSYMLVANTPNQVELSKNSQIKNMDISFTNTVKVLNEGIYKIDYFFHQSHHYKVIYLLN